MKTNNVITYEQINDALMKFFDDHEPLVESEPEPERQPYIPPTVSEECKAVADKYFINNYELLTSSRGIYSLT